MKRPDFERAFRDGERVKTFLGRATVATKKLADLVLPSGRIVAGDPMAREFPSPLAPSVAAGKYAVTLSVVATEEGERVACAAVDVGREKAKRWRRARLESGDDAFEVDSGFAALMDAVVARSLAGHGEEPAGELTDEELDRRLDDDDDGDMIDVELVTDSLWDALESGDEGGWSASDVVAHEPTGANVLAFTSGEGNGVYHAWLGLNGHGTVVSVVLDFGLIDATIEEDAEVAPEKKTEKTDEKKPEKEKPEKQEPPKAAKDDESSELEEPAPPAKKKKKKKR